MTNVVIVSAVRTPIGNFNGGLSPLSAHELGAIVIKAAIERAQIAPDEVDEVILGQILAAGEGQGPARQAARLAGVPDSKTAFSINQICGSGLRSVAIAAQQIQTGDASIMVAGGQESMSQSAHAIHMRNGTKMGNAQLVDTMIKDGLWDAFNDYHMGTTAENVAKKFGITREDQDAFPLTLKTKPKPQ